MSTEESQIGPDARASINNDLAERSALITEALRGISEAIVAADKTDTPPDLGPLVDHGLTLIYCGLMALNEIAHAQTIMMQLAQRDINAEVNALANDKATVLTEERIKSFGDRSFIGQKS